MKLSIEYISNGIAYSKHIDLPDDASDLKVSCVIGQEDDGGLGDRLQECLNEGVELFRRL